MTYFLIFLAVLFGLGSCCRRPQQTYSDDDEYIDADIEGYGGGDCCDDGDYGSSEGSSGDRE
jgi:hypothetical protein